MCARSWTFDEQSPERQLVHALAQVAGFQTIDLAIVLGSGWGHIADRGEIIVEYDYADWPCFPTHAVAGHAGSLRLIWHQGWQILCFSGRFHCYQGLSAFQASLPVRIASALGCPRILLTCASGGVNPLYRPGDFMWLSDHINLLGDNPLKGLPGEIFVDLSHLYQARLFGPLSALSKQQGAVLHRGVLAAMPGPSYETPAEVRLLSRLGADVVSMSMAHEAIMAGYFKMAVAGLALIANSAAGLTTTALNHLDVLDRAAAASEQAGLLIDNLVSAWKVMPAE